MPFKLERGLPAMNRVSGPKVCCRRSTGKSTFSQHLGIGLIIWLWFVLDGFGTASAVLRGQATLLQRRARRHDTFA